MKSVEKKLMEIEDRVSRLRELSSDIASFEDYQASRNYREMVERNLQVPSKAVLMLEKSSSLGKNSCSRKDNKRHKRQLSTE
ncbi:MAG: hypothetical protein LLF89_07070, partial [Spirochaetaceae bacterium]|nr:hypothetical protein [Spirochaetaceae bacterium]